MSICDQGDPNPTPDSSADMLREGNDTRILNSSMIDLSDKNSYSRGLVACTIRNGRSWSSSVLPKIVESKHKHYDAD